MDHLITDNITATVQSPFWKKELIHLIRRF